MARCRMKADVRSWKSGPEVAGLKQVSLVIVEQFNRTSRNVLDCAIPFKIFVNNGRTPLEMAAVQKYQVVRHRCYIMQKNCC